MQINWILHEVVTDAQASDERLSGCKNDTAAMNKTAKS
jgi:hypothetical protein